jgi:predicted RNA-binding protein with PUA-like domain
MARAHWLVKSEPSSYGWAELVQEKKTLWTGVRNHTAKGHLAAMKPGDLVFFYHSGEGKEIVGVAKVTAEAAPDTTAPADEGWLAVELAPMKPLAAPVTLATVKATPALRELPLVKLSRLSVMPIPKPAFEKILAMGKTKLAR